MLLIYPNISTDASYQETESKEAVEDTHESTFTPVNDLANTLLPPPTGSLPTTSKGHCIVHLLLQVTQRLAMLLTVQRWNCSRRPGRSTMLSQRVTEILLLAKIKCGIHMTELTERP